MSIQRRKRIYGKRRRKSPFRGTPPDNYYEWDYYEKAKPGDYCPPQPKSMTDAEYKKYCSMKEFKMPDFTTFNEPKETTTSLDKTIKVKELTNLKPVTGTPPIVGPMGVKVLGKIAENIDLEKELSNAWKSWMSGFTFRGRGND